jgi:hypothetical protein
MAKQHAMTEEAAAAIAALAELPAAPERLGRLAGLLPGFRARCARLYDVDVDFVEFDFLHPRP